MPNPGDRFSYCAVDENREEISDHEEINISTPTRDEDLTAMLRSLATETLDKFPDGFDTFQIELVSRVADGEPKLEYIPFSQLLK